MSEKRETVRMELRPMMTEVGDEQFPQVNAWATAGENDARVSFQMEHCTGIGAADMEPEEARELAAMLNRAADWCERHNAEALLERRVKT